MAILAEISDKMPSIGAILVAAIAVAVICAAVAAVNGIVAWSMLSLTFAGGCFLACVAFDDAFASGPLRDAVWNELGWPWVLADIASPFLPTVFVAGVLRLGRMTNAETPRSPR